MSLSFVLGNFLGRAAISYGLVLAVFLLWNRFQWRRAVSLSLRWYALLLVVILTLLGTAAVVVRAGHMQ